MNVRCAAKCGVTRISRSHGMKLRCFLPLILLSLAMFAAPGCADGDASRPEPNDAGASGNDGEGGESGESGEPGEAGSGGGGGEAGSDSGTSGAGGKTAGCEPLGLGKPFIHFNAFGEVTGLRYPLATPLGDADLADYVLVELYDSTTPAGDDFLPPLEAGEFDLSRPPNDSPLTCQHCVLLATDVTEGFDPLGFPIFQAERWYFQQRGALELEEVHDPLNEWLENTAMAGNVANVELFLVDRKSVA